MLTVQERTEQELSKENNTYLIIFYALYFIFIKEQKENKNDFIIKMYN